MERNGSRKEAKEKAKAGYFKVIDRQKKLPKSVVHPQAFTGELKVKNYTDVGTEVYDWRTARKMPLNTDVYERFDQPISIHIGFEDYVKYTKAHPFIKKEMLKGGLRAGEVVSVEIDRQLSLQMFLAHIGLTKAAWEKKKKEESFTDICENIEQYIEANQIDGALVGAVDAGFVAKLNRMGDSVTITHQKALNVDITVNGEKLPQRIGFRKIEDAQIIETED